MRVLWLLVALTFSVNVSRAGEAVRGLGVIDVAKLRKEQGVDKIIPSPRSLRDQRVVIIDRSFAGFVEGSGQLPDSARLYETYHLFPEGFKNSLTPAEQELFMFDDIAEYPAHHGLDLAKAHWAMMSGEAEGPQYALVVARTVTEIRRAAKFADWWGARYVVCALNIPNFGNRNGIGEEYNEIAQFLSRDSRRFWVNSAGNYERLTHTANVRLDRDERVIFKNGRNYLRLKMRVDAKVQITAAWDSFNPQGNDKNLDLYVLGEDGRTVYSYEKRTQGQGEEKVNVEHLFAQSELIQHVLNRRPIQKEAPAPLAVPPPPAPALDGEEKPAAPKVDKVEVEDKLVHPLEEIVVPLKKNTDGHYYYIVLESRGGHFTTKDEIRVVVRPDSIEAGWVPDEYRKSMAPALELIDWTSGNNVYYPGDFKDTLTVGEIADETSRGLTGSGVVKPEVFLPRTNIVLSNGRMQSGTSGNTFLMAGHLGLQIALYPDLTRAEFARYLQRLELPPFSMKANNITHISEDPEKWNNQYQPYISSQFPNVFQLLQNNTNGQQLLAVGVDQNGLYQFGYPVSPSTFRQIFGETAENAGDSLEYYLSCEQQQTNQFDNNGQPITNPVYQGHTRKKRTDSQGEEESLPWLRDDARVKNPNQYIQLRRMLNKSERTALKDEMARSVGKVWRVPTDLENQGQ